NMLGDSLTDGLIVVKYGHDLPLPHKLQRINVREGGHPVPDAAGALAAQEMLKLAHDCTQDDLLLCVFTGGASALTPALCPGIALSDMQTLTARLLECGATIHEINMLRKHLSCFSGGGLARAAFPASVLSLLVSDVVGDNLDVIASGPTVPDPSTFADCWRIVQHYGLVLPKRLLERLQQGRDGVLAETPKAGDPIFARVCTVLVATVQQALEAAALEARRHGVVPQILTSTLTGEARQCARELVAEAVRVQAGLAPDAAPICLLAGGESTVTVRGTGKGGRNQEMALAALLALADTTGIHMVCVGTDGTDGPTDAAGGFAHSKDLARIRALGLDPEASLANNDSYHLLDAANRLLRTGPTRTNVMYLVLLVIERLPLPPAVPPGEWG
ncbi:MAG: DUF4147 domain-containing protein, partial [Bilophila sp.]